MRVHARHIFFMFLLIIALHISAVLFGWYNMTIVWVDNIQHIIAGIALSMVYLAINKKRNGEIKNEVLRIIMFVLITAILWELFEFSLLTFLPTYAQKFSLYSPTILEALEDIFSNLIGSILFILISKNK